MHVNNEEGSLDGSSSQKFVIIVMTKVLYVQFLFVNQLKLVDMSQMILYFSILLHWYITASLISVYNAT
jgi:hypothetical protein